MLWSPPRRGLPPSSADCGLEGNARNLSLQAIPPVRRRLRRRRTGGMEKRENVGHVLAVNHRLQGGKLRGGRASRASGSRSTVRLQRQAAWNRDRQPRKHAARGALWGPLAQLTVFAQRVARCTMLWSPPRRGSPLSSADCGLDGRARSLFLPTTPLAHPPPQAAADERAEWKTKGCLLCGLAVNHGLHGDKLRGGQTPRAPGYPWTSREDEEGQL